MISPDQSPVKLSVSIVLHNSSLEQLRGTLGSLQRAARIARAQSCVGAVSVVVVDNSGDDGYRGQVSRLLSEQEAEPLFQLSYSPQAANRGFGAGHNYCIDTLDSDYHLVLNPDVELQDDTLLVGLAALAEDRGIVLLSPRVDGSGGAQEFLCKRYPTVLALVARGFFPRSLQRLFRKRLDDYEMRDTCQSGQAVDVPLASGCFMLVRSEALSAVNGFDDRYFLYFEDFDLSLRLAGQGRLVYYPGMRIVHHGGYAASKGLRHVRYFVTAGITFFNQHGWRWI